MIAAACCARLIISVIADAAKLLLTKHAAQSRSLLSIAEAVSAALAGKTNSADSEPISKRPSCEAEAFTGSNWLAAIGAD